MNVQEITREIMTSELTNDEIRRLWDTLKTKDREVRTRQAMIVASAIGPKSKVKIFGLKQKQLNGLVAEVVSVQKTRAQVQMPDDWLAGRYRNSIVGIPMNCLEVVSE